MRLVVQRVSWARVVVDGSTVGEIKKGLMVLVAAGRGDTDEDVAALSRKIVSLRVFGDEQGNLNLSLAEVPDSAILAVSQFTLYGDCRKGRRPSFVAAESPKRAEELYEAFIRYTRAQNVKVETGRFGAMMQVELCNDGPVTLLLDSRRDS